MRSAQVLHHGVAVGHRHLGGPAGESAVDGGVDLLFHQFTRRRIVGVGRVTLLRPHHAGNTFDIRRDKDLHITLRYLICRRQPIEQRAQRTRMLLEAADAFGAQQRIQHRVFGGVRRRKSGSSLSSGSVAPSNRVENTSAISPEPCPNGYPPAPGPRPLCGRCVQLATVQRPIAGDDDNDRAGVHLRRRIANSLPSAGPTRTPLSVSESRVPKLASTSTPSMVPNPGQ